MNMKKQKSGIFRLIEIAGAKKWWLFGSMFLAVCAAIAQFIPYISVYKIIKELAANAMTPAQINKDFIWHWGYVSLISICIYGAIYYVSNMMSHIAAFNILYELRIAISRKLVKLPLGFFTKNASGEIKKIMSEDVERIELFIAHHIPDITTAIVFPLLTMIYLFTADWRLAMVILIIFIIAIAIQYSMMFNSKARKRMAEYHTALGHMNNSIIEYVRGIQIVKVFNRSVKAFERLRNNIFSYRDYSIGITGDFAFIYTGFLTILSSVLLFLIPSSVLLLFLSPSYTDYIPTVFLFLILGTNLFFPMLKLMFAGGYLVQNIVGIELIDNILQKVEITEPLNPEIPKNSSVEFCNVSFAYDETPVLKNISFKARPGNVIALVGPSGSGKSTIGMLTARFWDVTSGNILIGGVSIKNITYEYLMKYIAPVFQDNMLFFDTIEENIRMGNKKATFEEVIEAARHAQCHTFIEKLDHGYQTLVGEGGVYLSGGEQQRIALARAILKNAPVIILDEATAYADPENEGKILSSFSKLIKGKTVLVIAHRLSTITNADRILVIDRGTVVEAGTHNALLDKKGVYFHMWETYTKSREWVIERKEKVHYPAL